MWPPSFNEIIDIILILALVLIVGYVFWLRAKMEKSKASFALSLIGSMTALTLVFVKAITGSETSTATKFVYSLVNKETGVSLLAEPPPAMSMIATCALLIIYVVAMYLFYKIARVTILRWEGPITVTVNELAKNETDNDLHLLALAELRRLFAGRPDPLANDEVVNWRQKIIDPPEAQPWHIFIRQIFSVAFSEAELHNNDWRDQWNAWVGRIYVSEQRSGNVSVPLLLFLFEQQPSEQDLNVRISSYIGDGASINDAKLFAIYYSKTDA
jgi:hypothetical protein